MEHSRTIDAATLPLDALEWHDRVVRELPVDDSSDPSARTVTGAACSLVDPTPTASPRTIAWVDDVAQLLGLDADLCRSDDFAAVMSGNRVPVGARPYAMNYGGHQFGTWARQLGDGRAITLGELADRDGRLQSIQLKGAGPTPYSRFADGRAVLRSSIRELLCSEAMHHLGIPTTRALSLVATGDQVMRDVMYDGNPRPEPGAVVCRVAPSFLRFGTFELPARRGDLQLLEQLVAFAIRTEQPDLWRDGVDVASLVPEWFARICDLTCDLVVEWMRVGFVHGVLNTDNMSTSGLTIDYGPYGWLEDFDPGFTPNTTDAAQRRYRYGWQPQVVQWNLLQLAQALVQLTRDVEPLQEALEGFTDRYQQRFDAMFVRRLGWNEPAPGDPQLIAQLLELLQRTEVDQVLFFRELARVPVDAEASRDDVALLAPLTECWYRPRDLDDPDLRGALVDWLTGWGARVRAGGLPDDERIAAMDALNPRYVLRNWIAQEAIDLAETGDESRVHELLEVLRRPYVDQPGREHLAQRRPDWARDRIGCSQLSCSS
jgi:serine/tyrosine/threonine adenylyltransferase